MQMSNKLINIQIYPHFQWVLQDNKHIMLACVYARGAGKTYFGFDWCFSKVMNNPDPNATAIIVTTDFKKGRYGLHEALGRYDSLIQQGIMKFNEHSAIVTIKTSPKNSIQRKQILLLTYNQREKIRGYHPIAVLLDEAQEMPRDTYEFVIAFTLKAIGQGGQFLVLGTPNGTNNALYDIYKRGTNNNDPDNKSVLLNGYDLKYSPRQLEFYKRNLSPNAFRREIMCDFAIDASYGNIYTDILDKLKSMKHISNDIKYNAEFPINLAFDLGYNDATACWIWQVVTSGEGIPRIHVIKYIEWTQQYFQDIIPKIRALPFFTNKIKYCILPHDSVQHHVSGGNPSHQTVNDFSTFDTNTVYGQAKAEGWDAYVLPRTSSVSSCIAPCRAFLEKCFFNETECAQGLQHLNKYKYTVKILRDNINPQCTDKPEEIGDHLHCCDAFRYMAMSENIWNTKEPKNIIANDGAPWIYTDWNKEI